MDVLSFILQVLDRALNILAGLALAAPIIYIAHEAGFQPIASLPYETYAALIVAGIVAACIAIVRISIWAGTWFWSWNRSCVSGWQQKRKRKKQAALNVFQVDDKLFAILAYHFERNERRILACKGTRPLWELEELGLLETADDGTLRSNASHRAYVIPDYVWDRLVEAGEGRTAEMPKKAILVARQ